MSSWRCRRATKDNTRRPKGVNAPSPIRRAPTSTDRPARMERCDFLGQKQTDKSAKTAD